MSHNGASERIMNNPPFHLPLGPLGFVRAGECVGQCCEPPQAAYGKDEVCWPAQ